jgi:alpha-ketoglutaric semialdehyde dehydrogenase
MDATRAFLASLNLPPGDAYDLPTSPRRFPGGGQYRVEIPSIDEAAAGLVGNLTGTIHAEPGDAQAVAPLVAVLRDKVGRLVRNGYPTGVAVVPAMQHGGPYPATTASGHTSVGLVTIRRFLRPVAHQHAPQQLMPPALADDNPLRIRRLVDGLWTEAPLAGG